jgi:Peptidase family M20/M25/M40
VPTGSGERIRGEVRSQFGRLTEDLADLVAIPSVSALGFPEETRPALLEAHTAIVDLLRDAGVEQLGSIDLPDTAPVITGEIPAPDGAPTVLLYSHYDVVGAGDESKWESPPFEASERDGAIFGRGTADSKSNILMHVGALRAWGGAPPVGIKIVIEGQEESGSPLIDFSGDASRALRRRRDGDRRHGQPAAGRPDADDRPAWDGGGDRGGEDARRAEAQRTVRRRRPRRARRAGSPSIRRSAISCGSAAKPTGGDLHPTGRDAARGRRRVVCARHADALHVGAGGGQAARRGHDDDVRNADPDRVLQGVQRPIGSPIRARAALRQRVAERRDPGSSCC